MLGISAEIIYKFSQISSLNELIIKSFVISIRPCFSKLYVATKSWFIMRLEMWLKLQQMDINLFAEKIGKSRNLVHKYIHEDVIPRHKVMIKIYRITLGSVTANDFYRLSEQIFKEDLRCPTKEVLHPDSFKF